MGARALLAMSQVPSEDEEDDVNWGGEEEPQVTNADDDRWAEYERKYNEEKNNIDKITGEFPEDMQYEFSTNAWEHVCLTEMLSPDRNLLPDHKEFTDEDEKKLNDKYSWSRPYFAIAKCSLGGCKAKNFPWKAGAFSYVSKSRARMQFAVHLIRHEAHLWGMRRAIDLAFDYNKTRVYMGYENFNQRRSQRRLNAQHQADTGEFVRSWSFTPAQFDKVMAATTNISRSNEPLELTARPRTPERTTKLPGPGRYFRASADQYDYNEKAYTALNHQLAVAAKRQDSFLDNIQRYHECLQYEYFQLLDIKQNVIVALTPLEHMIPRFETLVTTFAGMADIAARGSRSSRGVARSRTIARSHPPAARSRSPRSRTPRSITARRSANPRRHAPRSTRNEHDGEDKLRRSERKDEDASPLRRSEREKKRHRDTARKDHGEGDEQENATRIRERFAQSHIHRSWPINICYFC